MKIGISKGSYGTISLKDEIRLMKENGFTATFMENEYEEFDRDVTTFRSEGIEVETIHAPFDGINEMWKPGDSGNTMLTRLIGSLNAAKRNEIPLVVVHLSSGKHPPKISEIGNERFDRLIQHARKVGVEIAFENQRKLGNIAHVFDYYDDVRFCWDIGHEACFAGGREFMPLFGNRLAALHIHDNNAEDNKDYHMLPYDGKIDLDRAARQIAATGFYGTAMLEVSRQRSPFYDTLSPEEYFRRAGEAARKFATAVEEYRTK